MLVSLCPGPVPEPATRTGARLYLNVYLSMIARNGNRMATEDRKQTGNTKAIPEEMASVLFIDGRGERI